MAVRKARFCMAEVRFCEWRLIAAGDSLTRLKWFDLIDHNTINSTRPPFLNQQLRDSIILVEGF